MASSLYRLLAGRIGRGYEQAKSRHLFRDFVDATAAVTITGSEIQVRYHKRAHNPLLVAAGFDRTDIDVPWLGVSGCGWASGNSSWRMAESGLPGNNQAAAPPGRWASGVEMDKNLGRILACLTVLMPAAFAVLHAADVPQPATLRSPDDASDSRVLPTPDDGADKTPKRKNLLIIGASSLISPLGQPQLVGALLESKGIQMNVEGKFFGTEAVDRMLGSRQLWDYVIMDAWQFRRGRTDPPEFPDAVAAFVKQVRAHSPNSKIILFPWWIPRGPDATNEGVMRVFHRCVEEAKQNDIWVATTGPAFMEARLERPDLHVTVSEQDAHPGIHGAYINACSLFAILTGESPVGLPATLKIPGRDEDLTIAPDDAKYLQELAWKVYRREIKNTKPAR